MCKIWGTTPSTTKLMLFKASSWTTHPYDEDVYVDIRAKATPSRTRDLVLDNMGDIQEAFKEHGLVANVRLEVYDGPDYFHVPPPSST